MAGLWITDIIKNVKNEFLCLTFKALEGLKEFSESLCGELFMVLGRHLDADLQVLPDVS